jgi:hypothetical protein
MSTRNFAGTAEERRLTDQLEGFAGSSPDLAERPRPISPLDVPWSGPSLRNPTVDYASPLTLEQREESLPLLLTTTLVVTHHFQFGLGVAGVFFPLLNPNDERLLLRKPPLASNHITLQLPQFIQK